MSAPALPPLLQKPLGAASIGCGVVLVVLGATVAGSATPGAWDTWARTILHRLFPDAWSTALAIDLGGEPVGALLLSGLLAGCCMLVRHVRLAVLAITSQGTVGAASSLVKPIFGRTIHEGHLSYPSGHTAGATALALALALLLVRLLPLGRRMELLFIVGAVTAVGTVAGAAQIWLYAHYATDTIGGFCLAVALIPPLALLIDRLGDRMVVGVRRALWPVDRGPR